ncbi:MAG: 1-acyl-sn-glycerol-3-phosphate acyltransferase, partial [Chloroflexi bacterium]|nr:1-acyl-sn-glycerol-3-phosphate acyltransferase [Chloroflexota bacterium]
MESWFYNLINPILRLVVTVLMKWEVTGIEHIPMQGPLIVVANHISFLDGVFLAMAIPRQVHLFMKVEGLNIPILGGFLGLWGAFPVRRGVVDRLALRKALDVLDEDKVLGVFPEGT